MGDGYGVDKPGMDKLAKRLRQLGRDLGDAETPLRGRGSGSADELGEFANGAYAAFFEAWAKETDVIMGALGQLATQLEKSAGTYSAIDSEHAGGYARSLN